MCPPPNRRGSFVSMSIACRPKQAGISHSPGPDHSVFQFVQVVFELAHQYPKAETIRLVMDNLNIHGGKFLTDRLGEIRNRFITLQSRSSQVRLEVIFTRSYI